MEIVNPSQDLIVDSTPSPLHISLQISYENLVLDQDNNFYLLSLSIKGLKGLEILTE